MSKPGRIQREHGKPDLALVHGVRFHLAPPTHKMPARQVMLLFGRTVEGMAACTASLDEAWPKDLPTITAVVVGTSDDLDEAISSVGAHLGPGAH